MLQVKRKGSFSDMGAVHVVLVLLLWVQEEGDVQEPLGDAGVDGRRVLAAIRGHVGLGDAVLRALDRAIRAVKRKIGVHASVRREIKSVSRRDTHREIPVYPSFINRFHASWHSRITSVAKFLCFASPEKANCTKKKKGDGTFDL
jgi:hypothetical protein